MFFTGANMRTGRDQQPLSYDVRLPDEAQADALRLLDASRAMVNTLLARLWSRLDEFMGERSDPAWKQVVAMTPSPDPHGDRQFRCEAETAGRIMRAQYVRKQVFELIGPILSDGFIRPKRDGRPAGKNRTMIKEAIAALHKTREDDDTAFLTMHMILTLPACLVERLKEGVPLAPTLRELVKADGSRVAVLDVIVQVPKTPLADWQSVERVLGFDWGVHGLITAVVLSTNASEKETPVQVSRPLFVNTGGLDGYQARTRRQIDALKAARDRLADGDRRRANYEAEISRCWRVYEARNRELAHLAAKDTKATWWVSASARSVPGEPLTPAPVAASPPKRIALHERTIAVTP
jgi:hypothetical protein